MSSSMMRLICTEYHASLSIILKEFHTTSARGIDLRWRRKNGLTRNPNTCGPLTDGPDYTFKNNTPTPLGVRQFTRIEKQKQYAERIIKLVREVDYAVERHAKLQEKEKMEEEERIKNRLIEKGTETLNA